MLAFLLTVFQEVNLILLELQHSAWKHLI